MAFYGTCGNIGLKNPMLPMFRSFCAFGSEVHKAVSTGGEMKRKCVVSNDCPPWPKFDCGEQKGLLVEAGDAPAPRLGRAQLRAISGKLVKEQLEKVARDDPCNYRWQGREMWQGKQRWPDPFVPAKYTTELILCIAIGTPCLAAAQQLPMTGLFAEVFASPSPLYSPAPRGRKPWKLLDVNLIIIGSGPLVEQLLRRRVDAGGRACLLWTSVPPRPPPKWAGACHDEPDFDEETFTWQPPLPGHGPEGPEIQRVRRCFGSASYGFIRAGPDVIGLADGEQYELLMEGQTCVGVRVLADDVLSWQLSGAVLLVGPWESTGDTQPPAQERGEAWVLSVNVGVEQEEAKPMMYIDGGGPAVICLSAAYFLVSALLTHSLVNAYEPTLQPKNIDWWCLIPRTMTWSAHVWSHYLSRGLLGFPQTYRTAMMSAVAGFAVWTAWELLFLLQISRNEWRVQYFVMSGIGFQLSEVTEVVLSFWLQRSLKVLPHLGGRAQDVKSQAFFAAFLFSLHMLLLFSQFIIITVYVYVDRTSTVAAGLFLSLSTSGSELLATSWTETFYTKLVWPRAGDQPAVVWGDQNSIATVLLAWAHSMAEGSRLVCLLCAAARSTSWYWGWFANVALMIFCNLSVRHGYHVSALVRVLPWAARSLKPCCFALILRQARFMCGYYRFLAIGTYALWRVFWLGAEPLFNTQTLVLFITVLVAEVVEDTVVLRRWLPLDVWRDQLKHCYWALHPFHPRQAVAMLMFLQQRFQILLGPRIDFAKFWGARESTPVMNYPSTLAAVRQFFAVLLEMSDIPNPARFQIAVDGGGLQMGVEVVASAADGEGFNTTITIVMFVILSFNIDIVRRTSSRSMSTSLHSSKWNELRQRTALPPKTGNKMDVVSAVNLVDNTPLVINRLGITAVVCVKECEALKPNEAHGVDHRTKRPCERLLAAPGEQVLSQLGASWRDLRQCLDGGCRCRYDDHDDLEFRLRQTGPMPFGDSLSFACRGQGGPHAKSRDVARDLLGDGSGLFDVAEGHDDGQIGLRFDVLHALFEFREKWIAQRWFRYEPYQRLVHPLDLRFDGLPLAPNQFTSARGDIRTLSQKKPNIYVIEEFLSSEECDLLAHLGRSRPGLAEESLTRHL
ncbi:unnamed protein product, partial [Symbiodinium sp. KB8]